MILLCNGDSWTGGMVPSQTPNFDSKKTLDWYDLILILAMRTRLINLLVKITISITIPLCGLKY